MNFVYYSETCRHLTSDNYYWSVKTSFIQLRLYQLHVSVSIVQYSL